MLWGLTFLGVNSKTFGRLLEREPYPIMKNGNVDKAASRKSYFAATDLMEAARLKGHTTAGRLVTPDEIAAMAAYLVSDETSSVVGAGMIVDGGMTAR